MSTNSTDPRHMETIAGIAVPLTGAGVILLALMPLALPIVVLTIAAAIPLLVGGLLVGLVVGVVAAPVVVVRRLLRHRRERGAPSGDYGSITRYSTYRSRSRIPRAS